MKNDIESKFEDLIKENELLLLKVCRIYTSTPQDNQDLFQEIVIQIWRSFNSFKGNSKITTWMYKIAIYTALMRVRKEKSSLIYYDFADMVEKVVISNSEISSDANLEKLYAAISKLKPVEKAIVMLYLDGKSYSEMNEILGIGAANLRVKMTRIKDKLRQLIN